MFCGFIVLPVQNHRVFTGYPATNAPWRYRRHCSAIFRFRHSFFAARVPFSHTDLDMAANFSPRIPPAGRVIAPV